MEPRHPELLPGKVSQSETIGRTVRLRFLGGWFVQDVYHRLDVSNEVIETNLWSCGLITNVLREEGVQRWIPLRLLPDFQGCICAQLFIPDLVPEGATPVHCLGLPLIRLQRSVFALEIKGVVTSNFEDVSCVILQSVSPCCLLLEVVNSFS